MANTNSNTSKEVVYIINARGRKVGVSPRLAEKCLKQAGFSLAEAPAKEAKKEESKK